MKKIFIFTFILMLLMPCFIKAEKLRVGVLRFTNDTAAGWWSGNLGRELQDMLAAEMVNTKAFSVLDRKDINAVLGEQDLGNSGRIDPATKAKIGKIKGAKYLVAGTLSAFDRKVKSSGGGIGFKGISLRGKKEEAYVAIDVKVIDTVTGEVVDARTIEARTKGHKLGAGYNKGSFSVNGGKAKNTALGKAVRACVIYVCEYLECSLAKVDHPDCMKKWNKMDKKRRKKTKNSISLD